MPALVALIRGVDDPGGDDLPEPHADQGADIQLDAGSAGRNEQADGHEAEQQGKEDDDEYDDDDGEKHVVFILLFIVRCINRGRTACR